MTPSRLLVISQPSQTVIEQALAVLRRHSLDRRLGGAMFKPGNWHQTWSGRYADTPALRALLRQVGDSVSAPAFTLPFNRIGGREHWAMHGRGKPAGFLNLLAAMRAALSQHGLDAPNHHPHMTISYRAPEPLATIAIPVIE